MCLQVSFNFVYQYSRKFPHLHSKNFEYVFLEKGKEIPIVNLDAD